MRYFQQEYHQLTDCLNTVCDAAFKKDNRSFSSELIKGNTLGRPLYLDILMMKFNDHLFYFLLCAAHYVLHTHFHSTASTELRHICAVEYFCSMKHLLAKQCELMHAKLAQTQIHKRTETHSTFEPTQWEQPCVLRR